MRATSLTVAGVCDPGLFSEAGLTEASYSGGFGLVAWVDCAYYLCG